MAVKQKKLPPMACSYWTVLVSLVVFLTMPALPSGVATNHNNSSHDGRTQKQESIKYYSLKPAEMKKPSDLRNGVWNINHGSANLNPGKNPGLQGIGSEPTREDFLSLLEGCATVFKPADNEETIMPTMSVQRCVNQCREAGYYHAALGRCFTVPCHPEGEAGWHCSCNYDGIAVYADDPSQCDESCPASTPSSSALVNITKTRRGDAGDFDDHFQGGENDEERLIRDVLPCGATEPGFLSVYATSEDFLLGGTTAERIESEGTSFNPVANRPRLDCSMLSSVDAEVDVSGVDDVDTCCQFRNYFDHQVVYSLCVLSSHFWYVTWPNQITQASESPNFFANGHRICGEVAGGDQNASLYFAFPDQIADINDHLEVAIVVRHILENQDNDSKNQKGSVLTAGGASGMLQGVPGSLRSVNWYLPHGDDFDASQVSPGDCTWDGCISDVEDATTCYRCQWPGDYSSVSNPDAFISSVYASDEILEAMGENALPLAFTDFWDQPTDPLPLQAIGAKHCFGREDEACWEWDKDRTPWYILCQSPEKLTSSTTEPYESTSLSYTSFSSLMTEDETSRLSMSTSEASSSSEAATTISSTGATSTESTNCKTPEESIAFTFQGITDFNGVLKTDCPEGWWGKFEMLQCKNGGQVVWKKRCSALADWDLLFQIDVESVAETLGTLSEIIEAREGNITGDELLIVIENLDPMIQDFLLELESVTDPLEAFQTTDNFTQGFLQVTDSLLEEGLVWEQYNPVEPNATAASSKLIGSLEKVGGILANQLPLSSSSPSASHRVDSRNVLMGVTRRTTADVILHGNRTLYFPDENSDSYIKIPAGYHTLLPLKPNRQVGSSNDTAEDASHHVKTLGVVLKKSEEAVFPGSRNIMGKPAKKKQVNSNILGFKFIVGENEAPLLLSQNSEPVSIVFKHNLKAQEPHYDTILRDLHPGEKPTALPDSGICSFLQPELGVTWSKEGCYLQESSEGRTVCACYHLTNFAVLMDVHGYVGKNLGLEVMGYVIGGLSVICLGINFIVFQFLDGAKTPTAVLTKHLSGTLLLGHLIMSAAFDKTYFVMSDTVCSLVAAAVHYLFLSSFCWMLMEGYVLYIRLVHIFQAEKKIPPWKYLSFGYLAPLILVGLTYGVSAGLGHDAYGRGEYCWLRSPDYIWSFAGPVLLIILVNGAFMTLALRSARTGLKQATAAKRQSLLSLKGCMSLSSILGLGWFMGYLYVVHSPVFAYLFTLLNASQGIWIFIFHVFLNDAVSTALRRFLERRRTIGEWSSKSYSATNRALEILENPIFNRRGRKSTKDHSTDHEYNSAIFGRDSTSTSSTRVNGGGDSFPDRRGVGLTGVVNPGFTGKSGNEDSFSLEAAALPAEQNNRPKVAFVAAAESVSSNTKLSIIQGYEVYSPVSPELPHSSYQPVYGNRWQSSVQR